MVSVNLDEMRHKWKTSRYLHSVKFLKNKIVDYTEYMDEGYENVGFVRKDIYNKLCRISRMGIEERIAQTIPKHDERKKATGC